MLHQGCTLALQRLFSMGDGEGVGPRGESVRRKLWHVYFVIWQLHMLAEYAILEALCHGRVCKVNGPIVYRKRNQSHPRGDDFG